MMEWFISIWILLFVAVGVALSIEVLHAHYDFRAERRAWAAMIHNRKLN